MPSSLLQEALLILALQGQLGSTCDMQKNKLICSARETRSQHRWEHQGTIQLTSRCCTNSSFI